VAGATLMALDELARKRAGDAPHPEVAVRIRAALAAWDGR
jgi:hypothetical protein